jgi:predicted thioesterase
MDELAVGVRGVAATTVTVATTAASLGSGDVPVFGTPAMVALMEAAAVQALADRLAPGETSVGIRLDVAHLAATPVGSAVRAEAELVAVEGRKLTFTVVAHDDRQKIGEGRHQRMRVVRDRFLTALGEAR